MKLDTGHWLHWGTLWAENSRYRALANGFFFLRQIYTAKTQGSLSEVAAAAYRPLLTNVVAAFPEERVLSLVQEIKALLGWRECYEVMLSLM
jgi:hypothetical protein